MGCFFCKDEIFQVVLVCFSEYGVDVIIIEMICDCFGVSIGSFYYYFGNKECIYGELYLVGIGQYVVLFEFGFVRVCSVEEMVRLLVISYIDWVVVNFDWVCFILYSCGWVEVGELGECLWVDNQVYFVWIYVVLVGYWVEGLFCEMLDDCFVLVVIGLVYDFVCQWLVG